MSITAGFNRRTQEPSPNDSPNGALQSRKCNAPLGLEFEGCRLPPVKTGGYRYFVPSGQGIIPPYHFKNNHHKEQ